MCLLTIAWQVSAEYPFVFAGNRDEYHARPSAAANWWDDAPDVLGGRDLTAGGSWLGITRDGRFAVVTNRPDLAAPKQLALSRGNLVADWLLTDRPAPAAPESFAGLEAHAPRYGGFSLIVGNLEPAGTGLLQQIAGGHGVAGLSRATLAPGVTGLSNTAPEQPWPKLQWLNQQVQLLLAEGAIEPDRLFDLLTRPEAVPDAAVTGVAASPFVIGEEYGTRSSTVIMLDRHGSCRFVERRFGPGAKPEGESAFEFSLTS